uniref:Uncharacterized protein n=1 Tax=Fagus sylvatica TaxID=28930 RepID=A0A2N9H1V7_FAGSY
MRSEKENSEKEGTPPIGTDSAPKLETRTHINPSLSLAFSFLGFEVLDFVQQKQELGIREVKEEEEA